MMKGLSFIFFLLFNTTRQCCGVVAAVHVPSDTDVLLEATNKNMNRPFRLSRTLMLPAIQLNKNDIDETRVVKGVSNNVVYDDHASHHYAIGLGIEQEFLVAMQQGTNEDHRELQSCPMCMLYYIYSKSYIQCNSGYVHDDSKFSSYTDIYGLCYSNVCCTSLDINASCCKKSGGGGGGGAIFGIIIVVILVILAIVGGKYFYDKKHKQNNEQQQQQTQPQAVNGVQQPPPPPVGSGVQMSNKPENVAHADTTASSYTENNTIHENIPVTTPILVYDEKGVNIPQPAFAPQYQQQQQQQQYIPTAPPATQSNASSASTNDELLSQLAQSMFPNNAEQQRQFISSIAQQYHSHVTSPVEATSFIQEFTTAAGHVANATNNVATALEIANNLFSQTNLFGQQEA